MTSGEQQDFFSEPAVAGPYIASLQAQLDSELTTVRSWAANEPHERPYELEAALVAIRWIADELRATRQTEAPF